MQQGNRHLGVSDEQAIERFIDVLSHGMWSQPRAASAREAPRRGKLKAPLRDLLPEHETETLPMAVLPSGNGFTK
jgi:hypothetical protein